ncbi:hypothetical protein PMAYCL1PPCAC_22054, partial [Pristionchus mayeri]
STTRLVSLQRAILQYPVMRIASILLIAVTLIPLATALDVVLKCQSKKETSKEESCDPANKFCYMTWKDGYPDFEDAGCAKAEHKCTAAQCNPKENGGTTCCCNEKEKCEAKPGETPGGAGTPPAGKFKCNDKDGKAYQCLNADTTTCYKLVDKNNTKITKEAGCAENAKKEMCKNSDDHCVEFNTNEKSCCCKGLADKVCDFDYDQVTTTAKRGAATSAFLLSTAAAMAAAGF